MPVRLIALDIDGTLLDSSGEIPEPNRRAVAEAAARGVTVALVTGRRYDFARPVADLLPEAAALIVSNGTLIKSRGGETLFRTLLPRRVARQVLDATPEFRDRAAVVFDRPCKRQIVLERIDWHDPVNGAYFRRSREYLAEVTPLEACLTEDPLQLVFTGTVDRMGTLHAALAALPADGFGTALTEYAHRDFSLIDVVRRGCSKASALRAWAGQQGIAPEEILAIGDNLNDVEMLELAGVPVVMGNAVAELRRRGWHVTLGNDEAGVAAAIERFVLNGGLHGC